MIDKIKCPSCDHQFAIEGVLAGDIEKQLHKKFNEERKALAADFNTKIEAFEKDKERFEELKREENRLFQERLQKEKIRQAKDIEDKMGEQFQTKLQLQLKEIEDSKNKIKALQSRELELLKMQREIDEKLKEKEIALQRQMIEERSKMEDELAKKARQEIDLKLMEKDKKLEDQRKLIEELKRKSEQGSMQLQGEVQELALEQLLRELYPYDQVEEVPKGIRGADSIQTVVNDQFQACGRIIYESKRTKAFANDWIPKLKDDQRAVQADLAVLVTQVLPKDMEQFGMKDGIWLCTFEEIRSLSFVLRELLIKIREAKATEENKGDKMTVLYNYLTSEEFKLQITGIVEGFQHLHADLEKEKKAMRQIWKKREKHLEMVIGNTIDMYGSIKGIAGSSIPSIDHLELPEG